MRIRKNGKVVRLTESDLQRIVKRTLNEGEILTGGTSGDPKLALIDDLMEYLPQMKDNPKYPDVDTVCKTVIKLCNEYKGRKKN